MVPLYFLFVLFVASFGRMAMEIPATELTTIDMLVAFAGCAALLTSSCLFLEISHTLKELGGQ